MRARNKCEHAWGLHANAPPCNARATWEGIIVHSHYMHAVHVCMHTHMHNSMRMHMCSDVWRHLERLGGLCVVALLRAHARQIAQGGKIAPVKAHTCHVSSVEANQVSSAQSNPTQPNNSTQPNPTPTQ